MKGVKKPPGAEQQLTPVSRSSRQQGEVETGANWGVCVPSKGAAAAQLPLIPANEECRPRSVRLFPRRQKFICNRPISKVWQSI